jgi:hypothetical protein
LTRATRLLSRQRAPTVPHVIISPSTVSRDIPGRYMVAFNNKAYANTNTMLEWLWLQYAHSSAYPFCRWEPNHKPRMLTLDVFKGQLNAKVLAKFKRMNCTCSFIPSRTTGFIQVCDVAINKPLKDRISELAKIHYNNHEDQWIENKYTVSDRQVMLVS